MNPHKFKLYVVIVLYFLALVFVAVGLGTMHHVDVTFTVGSPDDSSFNYGLFRYCESLDKNKEKCSTIDYSKLNYLYDDDYSQANVVYLPVVSYALACISFLFFVSAVWCTVSDSFLTTAVFVFGVAGIGGIIGGCLYTSDITDSWDSYNDVYPQANAHADFGWSFYVSMAANSVMVVVAGASFFLLHGFPESQRPV